MPHDPQRLADNMQKASVLWPEIIRELCNLCENTPHTESHINQHIGQAFMRYYQNILQKDPLVVAQRQLGWWQKSMEMWQQQLASFMQVSPSSDNADGAVDMSAGRSTQDRRFKAEAWQQNWLFDSLKDQYLLMADFMRNEAAHSVHDLDSHTAHMVQFYTGQWIDALSPSNYPWTNPEVMRLTVESDGENLIRGMQNLLEDLRRGQISMTSDDAFRLGENIATTPGKVVFENPLLQIIQYAPTTTQVYEKPMLIIPAWINKYYILDLQPHNSLVKWLSEQGYSVFVVSWVNPDKRHKNTSFEDYMLKGALEAVEFVRKASGEDSIHVTGYCLGGTLLSCLLSWLHSEKRQDIIQSATFLTTLVDFADAGDLKVFIDEPQIRAMETKMEEKGYLEGRDMAVTFNMLRPADLIWSFVVNNYLLGKEPVPFDLLYWNADATRMPAKMHSFYLREMYLKNHLVQPGKLKLGGHAIDLTRITTPCYLLATREDHIAPWKSTYIATQQYRGERRFVLAASGHIAGVINSPAKQKYNYWTNDKLPADPDAWMKSAVPVAGSWWPDWASWLAPRSGAKALARKPGDKNIRIIENAPGRYAKVKSVLDKDAA